MRVFFESIFDILYLITVIYIGVKLYTKTDSSSMKLFGIMTLILGVGDSFHLIPRVIALVSGKGFEYYEMYLGMGKFVTSITMTVFYVILYYIYQNRYHVKEQQNLTFAIYLLAIARIGICLLPQNEWLKYRQPLIWGIHRNIPFLILGIIIIILFYKAAKLNNDRAFGYMWLAITLSFGFYIPVVLFSGINENFGLLMIPKTVAYVWIVLIGYSYYMNGVPNDSK